MYYRYSMNKNDYECAQIIDDSGSETDEEYIIPLKRLLVNFLIKLNKTLEFFFVKLKNLLAFLVLVLILVSCGGNKDNFISKYDTNLAVSSKTSLIHFFCDYHKYVNTTLRPQKHFSYEPDIYTTDFIIDRYTKNDYISLINTTYNINLVSLFQQNSMDDFFLLFHKNVKEIISYKEPDKYDFEIKFSTLL